MPIEPPRKPPESRRPDPEATRRRANRLRTSWLGTWRALDKSIGRNAQIEKLPIEQRLSHYVAQRHAPLFTAEAVDFIHGRVVKGLRHELDRLAYPSDFEWAEFSCGGGYYGAKNIADKIASFLPKVKGKADRQFLAKVRAELEREKHALDQISDETKAGLANEWAKGYDTRIEERGTQLGDRTAKEVVSADIAWRHWIYGLLVEKIDKILAGD